MLATRWYPSSALCLFLTLEGKLTSWLADKKPYASQISIPAKKIDRIVARFSAHEPDAWLQAGLPALFGPNTSRPGLTSLDL